MKRCVFEFMSISPFSFLLPFPDFENFEAEKVFEKEKGEKAQKRRYRHKFKKATIGTGVRRAVKTRRAKGRQAERGGGGQWRAAAGNGGRRRWQVLKRRNAQDELAAAAA